MIWMEHPEKRLHAWREFRQEIMDLDLAEICTEIQQWWGLSPQSNISIDPYDMTTWPDPWEMVYQGDMCKYSTAIGMSYTLHCINDTVSNSILFVNDITNNDDYMVALIDETWVLNYNTCEITKWETVKDSLKIQDSWACSDVINVIHSK